MCLQGAIRGSRTPRYSRNKGTLASHKISSLTLCALILFNICTFLIVHSCFIHISKWRLVAHPPFVLIIGYRHASQASCPAVGLGATRVRVTLMLSRAAYIHTSNHQKRAKSGLDCVFSSSNLQFCDLTLMMFSICCRASRCCDCSLTSFNTHQLCILCNQLLVFLLSSVIAGSQRCYFPHDFATVTLLSPSVYTHAPLPFLHPSLEIFDTPISLRVGLCRLRTLTWNECRWVEDDINGMWVREAG